MQYIEITSIDQSGVYEVRQGYVEPIQGLGKGTQVKAGQVIGTYSKSLAPAYGAGITEHVHIQIKYNGAFVNPQNYIP